MNRFLRLTGLTVHSLLSIGLLVLLVRSSLVILFFHSTQAAGVVSQDNLFSRIILPSIFHVSVSFIGAIPLYLMTDSRNEVQKKLLLLLLFALSFSNLHIEPLHAALTSNILLNPSMVRTALLFTDIFIAYLFLIAGLFQQGINANKFGQFIRIGAAMSLLIAMFIPSAGRAMYYVNVRTIYASEIPWVLNTIGIISCFNFALIYIKERTRHNLIHCGGFILLIIGHLLGKISWSQTLAIIGIVSYIAGVLLVSPIGKSYRL